MTLQYNCKVAIRVAFQRPEYTSRVYPSVASNGIHARVNWIFPRGDERGRSIEQASATKYSHHLIPSSTLWESRSGSRRWYPRTAWYAPGAVQTRQCVYIYHDDRWVGEWVAGASTAAATRGGQGRVRGRRRWPWTWLPPPPPFFAHTAVASPARNGPPA